MKSACNVAAAVALFLAGWARAADAPAPATALTDDEQTAGWKLLFDGVSTSGWRGLGTDGFPKNWAIQDGSLKCLGGYKDAPDLVTVDTYENFELAFDWLFPKSKGNSGVKYRVQEQPGKGYAFGCEYQCWGDPEATGTHASGALYDLFGPQEKVMAPKGQFNQSRILVSGNHLEHWLNGVKVVEAEFGSEAMQAALAKSYFKKSDWGKQPRGHIALQNHHNEVLFRNIKIRVLPDSKSQ